MTVEEIAFSWDYMKNLLPSSHKEPPVSLVICRLTISSLFSCHLIYVDYHHPLQSNPVVCLCPSYQSAFTSVTAENSVWKSSRFSPEIQSLGIRKFKDERVGNSTLRQMADVETEPRGLGQISQKSRLAPACLRFGCKDVSPQWSHFHKFLLSNGQSDPEKMHIRLFSLASGFPAKSCSIDRSGI